jgi:hypothetical protein
MFNPQSFSQLELGSSCIYFVLNVFTEYQYIDQIKEDKVGLG